MPKNLFKTFPNQEFEDYVISGHKMELKTSTGKIYKDLTSGLTGHSILGWGDPDIIEAIASQLNKIGHTDCKVFGSDIREEFSSIFIQNTENELNRIFFSGGSGAEACEAAIHLSYQAHCENGNLKKSHYISREQSYHGATTEAMAVGDRPNLNFFKPLFPMKRSKIPEHNQFRKPDINQSLLEYENECVGQLETEILLIGAENVGGFIAETAMGGLVGDVPPTLNYWKKIREVCSKYNVHLILDEVWCGFGTSGKLLCCDWDKITPDLLFTGKGIAGGYMPLSCVATTEKIYEAIKYGSGRTENSTTFQGHSASVAAGLACLKKITEKQFLQTVFSNGKFFRETVENELKNNDFFSNVRGRGLRNSIEYQCEEQHLFGLHLAQLMKNNHEYLISGKWHRVSVYPALIINKNEIEEFLELFFQEFKNLSNSWTKSYRSNIKTTQYF